MRHLITCTLCTYRVWICALLDTRIRYWSLSTKHREYVNTENSNPKRRHWTLTTWTWTWIDVAIIARSRVLWQVCLQNYTAVVAPAAAYRIFQWTKYCSKLLANLFQQSFRFLCQMKTLVLSGPSTMWLINLDIFMSISCICCQFRFIFIWSE